MEAVINLDIWRQALLLVPLLGVVSWAAVTDYREKKVRNKLTYSAIILGLLLHVTAFGLGSITSSLYAVGITFVLGLLMMLAGWMGGGDVKLLMAIGAFLGLRGLGEIWIYSIFCGATLGFIQAIYTGYALEMLKQMWGIIVALFRMLYYRTTNVRYGLEPEDERSKIPFAVAILVGAILTYTEAMWGYPTLVAIIEETFASLSTTQ